MFSQVSVSHSVNRGWVCLVPCHFQGISEGISGPKSLLGEGMSTGWVCPGWVCLRGGYPKSPNMDQRGVSTHPLLTPSGNHHTYDWQANGTHPTGMLLKMYIYVGME